MVVPGTGQERAVSALATRRGRWGAAAGSAGHQVLDLQRVLAVDWSISYVALLVYIFVITTYRVPLGTASMLVAVVALPLERRRIRIPLPLGIFGAFVLWNGIALVLTPFGSFDDRAILLVAKIWLVMFVAVNVVTNRRRFWFFLIFFLFCFATHPARGAIFNYVAGYRFQGRALWNQEFGNSNQLAGLALLQLSLAASLLHANVKGVVRWGAGASVVVLPLLILLTQSRGAFIGMVVFVLLAFAGTRRKVQLAGLCVVVAAAALITAPPALWQRLGRMHRLTSVATLAQADDRGSAAQRFKIWQTATQVIRAYPVTGVGMGAYPAANEAFAPEIGAHDVHSTYLNVLAEGGVFSLLLLSAMLFAIMTHGRRALRSLDPHDWRQTQPLRLLQAGLVGFLVTALWATFDGVQLFYLHLFIVWLAAEVLADQERPRARTNHRARRTGAGG